MSGVAVQPQAIRTFMIRYGDAARKVQPAPIVPTPHAIIEVTASKPKPVVVPVVEKKCATSKPVAKPAPVPEKVVEEVKEKEQEQPEQKVEEAPRNAEPTRIEVKVVKGKSEEAGAKETTPTIWKELKSATKKAPKAKKAAKATDDQAPEAESDKETAEKPHTKNTKESAKASSAKRAPDLTPLYKTDAKAAPAAKAKEEPTKIVVHIKAAEQEEQPEAKPAKKERSASTSALFEKLDVKAPAFSSHSLSSPISVEDNDDFQGSVVEFENKVASSKQMIDDKLSGADKIKLPSLDDDDSLI